MSHQVNKDPSSYRWLCYPFIKYETYAFFKHLLATVMLELSFGRVLGCSGETMISSRYSPSTGNVVSCVEERMSNVQQETPNKVHTSAVVRQVHDADPQDFMLTFVRRDWRI